MSTRGVDRSLTGAQKKCFLMRNPGDCRYPELFLSRSARITAWASLSALRSTLRSRCISFPMLCRTMPTKNIATVIGMSTQLRMSESRRSVLILASCCAVTLGVPVEGSPLQRKAPARNDPKCYASSSLRWARKG